MLIDVTAAGW